MNSKTLLAIAMMATCLTVMPLFAQSTSWSIAIETNPMTFPCGGRTIPVPAANSCDAAITVARDVFNAASGCLGSCANAAASAGAATCTVHPYVRPNGSRAQNFQVTLSYTCKTYDVDPVPACRDCDEAAEMKDGQPVIPKDATDIEGPADIEEDRGLLSSLYPGSDTTTDGFYPLPCEPSIGGTLPPDEPPTDDEVQADAILANFETNTGKQIVDQLKNNPLPAPSAIHSFGKGECFLITTVRAPVPCDSALFLMKDQPFEGRDIVYVHGLAPTQLYDKLMNPLPSPHSANKVWPQDASEFLDTGKYFRNYAEAYWRDHIRENLFDPMQPSNPKAGWQWTAADSAPRYFPKANRYMIVAWSSNQTLEYAQHAFLTQLYLAITTNKNVVTPPTYPSSFQRPFCSNGCIVISHSTGALLTSSALGLARTGFFGPGGTQIAGKVIAHVSLEGAISGSRLASVAMVIALRAAPGVLASNLLCSIYDAMFGTSNTCNADTTFVANSILRDLIPLVAQGVWGPFVDNSPAPTVTVAGGHPLGKLGGLGKPFLPGLDDGVASMNSTCGNPNLVLPGVLAPSGFSVLNPVKAFDFSENGGRLARGAKNWLSHRNLKAFPPLPNYLAGACTPYVSPTGMVMPALVAFRNTPWDARKRYRNHYSFIQGSIDHSYDPGDSSNNWPSASGQGPNAARAYKFFLTQNTEESSAITDPGIYRTIDGNGTHLVQPSFARIHEVVRGKRIRFRLFGKRRTIWIWKRTYHLLDKWEIKQSSHYVYEFVGRR